MIDALYHWALQKLAAPFRSTGETIPHVLEQEPSEVPHRPVVESLATASNGGKAWHLYNPQGADIHIGKIWQDYTGTGVLVGVVDDGIQYTHPEIQASYDATQDYDIIQNTNDGATIHSYDYHGTGVAGLIVAANDGVGLTGVAYGAHVTSFRYLSDDVSTDDPITDAIQALQLQANVDVSNNSWGFDHPFDDADEFTQTHSYLQDDVTNGRGGLGTVFVFAAGNERDLGGSANYSEYLNSRFTIAAAACDRHGVVSYFSSPGANVLVTAPGEDVYTTDLTGFLGGSSGNYLTLSGTSFSSPITAGVVALMLDANPNLGYRDVQEILAYSSDKTDPGRSSWLTNHADNWNGGGLHFSRDYGFGLINASAAVRMAETWTLNQSAHTIANEQSLTVNSGNVNEAISDNATVTSTVSVNNGLTIDHAEVQLNMTHQAIGDLVIKLTSPDGTSCSLMRRPEFGTDNLNYDANWTMSSAAQWGETGVGTWTLSVQDQSTGDTGFLTSWSLTLYGDPISNDNNYIYTQEYADLTGAANASRRVIVDAAGNDTINAAAVESDSVIDLSRTNPSSIAGNSLKISASTVIENAYTGDGDDKLYGNSLGNILFAGWGNDRIFGREGDDTIYGATGKDSITGGLGNDTLDGGKSNDLFLETHLDGADTLAGGSGVDTVSYDDNRADAPLSYNAVTGVATRSGEDDVFHSIEKLIATDASSDHFDASADVDGVSVNLTTGVVSGVASGITSISLFEDVTGGSGDDRLGGNNSQNQLDGGDGADTLNGGGGNDTLLGGNGDDWLKGSTGHDVLEGGAGDDTYYGFAEPFGSDVIQDQSGNNDVVDLSAYNLSSTIHWSALDNIGDGDSNVDDLQISIGTSSLTIAHYFDSTSTDPGLSGAGSGYVEHIVFNHAIDLDLQAVQQLLS